MEDLLYCQDLFEPIELQEKMSNNINDDKLSHGYNQIVDWCECDLWSDIDKYLPGLKEAGRFVLVEYYITWILLDWKMGDLEE